MSPRKFLTLLAGLVPVLMAGAQPAAASAAKPSAPLPPTHSAAGARASGELQAAPVATAQPNITPLNIVEYPIPGGGAGATPIQIIQGLDGNMWFSEAGGNRIGYINPAGAITEFTLAVGRSSDGLAIGPDGNIWFTEITSSGSPANPNTLSKITPTGILSEDLAVLPHFANELLYGPDGNFWVADETAIVRVTPAGTVTTYPIPGTPSVSSLTVGQDGKIWFADYGQNKFGRINLDGSALTEWSPPSSSSGPYRIVRGSDRNLWITEFGAGKIGKFSVSDPTTVTEYPVGGHSPVSIGAGPDGTMWFTTWASSANTVGTMSTNGSILNETVLPTAVSQPDAMFGGFDDGKMWFVERASGKIARVLAGGYAPLGFRWGLLPAMQNNAYGGYTTVTFVKNINPYPIMVNLLYSDSGGNSAGLGNNVYRLLPNATWTVRQDNPRALVNTGAGSGTIWADGEVAAFVNELAPGTADASSYSSINPYFEIGVSIFAPVAMKHAYGNQYTTGIGLVNLGASATDINIIYRDSAGTTIYTQHLAGIQPGAYQGVYQGDVAPLPDGFAGTAEIDAVDVSGRVAAVVNELGPNGEFSSFKATAAGSAPLFAPTLFRNAFGGYNTGLGLFNVTNQTGNVTITYYDSSGSSIPRTVAIAAFGAIAIYQGSTVGPNPNAPGADGAYTALITVDNAGVNLVGVVNELSPDTRVASSYDVPLFGTTPEDAALVENNGPDGVTTGVGVMNVTAASETVTLTFYDVNTGAQIGAPVSRVVPAYSFWSWYQGATIPNGGLAPGTRATAVVSGAAPFTIIVNEVGPNVFMSYGGGFFL